MTTRDTALSVLGFWWACIEAERQLDGDERLADDDLILHFCSHGAPDEETARNMHPNGGLADWGEHHTGSTRKGPWEWCATVSDVVVEYLGEAAPELKQGSICCSFNAG